MIKQALVYSVSFFLFPTVLQFLFKPEINWVDNIGLSIFAFFGYIFFAWKNKSAKKDNK